MERNKWKIAVLLVLLIALIISLLLLANERSDYRVKSLEETVNIDLDTVTKVSLSYPTSTDGVYHTTTDLDEIQLLLHYLNGAKYQRLNGDQSSYIPMRASIIYLYTPEEKSSFMVPYGKEAMIDYKVYQIVDGKIEKTFLQEYFHSIE